MIDSHAHVTFETFDDDRNDVIERAHAAGVTGWIEVGTDLERSKKAVTLAQQNKNIWASVGVHPSDITELLEPVWEEITKLAQEPRVVAIGEVGLDFFHTSPQPSHKVPAGAARLRVAGREVTTGELQIVALDRFVKLAAINNLPIIFHVRDGKDDNAHDALLEYLQSLDSASRPRGVIHTFSGTVKQAKKYLELGLYLSFSGVITFPNAGELIEVVRVAPIDRILIETDCPFLTPQAFRGKRNEPAYVKYVADKIAMIRNTTPEEISNSTEANTRTLFKFAAENY